MKLLVFYDISETKYRNLVVKSLEEFGFYRLQKSVFMGNINESKYRTFQLELRSHIMRTDLLYLVPVNDNSFRNIMTLGTNLHDIFQVIKKNEFDFEDIVI